MTSGYTIGIDLGTTNSAAAIVTAGEPEVLPNNVGNRTTPSVVSMTESGPIVGESAVNQRAVNPDRTVANIKRHMGEDDYTVTLGNTEFTPQEVSAFILKQLISDAEDYLGGEVTDVVITVPAYFGNRERQATKTAGEIAGVNVKRIINEPTAACLAYGLSQESEDIENVLVYDLGGGTFDVSIVEISDGVIEVLATGGNDKLGGKDWDDKIVSWIVNTYEAETGVDVSEDIEAMERVRKNAQEAKHMLSSKDQANVMIPYLSEEGNFNDILSRDEFEEMTQPLLYETIETCRDVMKEADATADTIDKVLLVGGSTRMPQVHEMVQNIFGIKVSKEINPDECVAIGASLKASMMTQESSDIDAPEDSVLDDDLVLIDVTPKTIGIQLADGTMDPLIKKNEKVPTTVEESGYTTARDNQTQVHLRVFEGERNIAEQNELLDEFYMKGIPPAPAGEPNLAARFHLNIDGILEVSAYDEDSGLSEQITIEGVIEPDSNEIQELESEHPDVVEQ